MASWKDDQELFEIAKKELFEIEGVRIDPGDLIYGDRDGVLVIPREVEKEAFSGAIEKARGEQLVKKALQEGMSTVDAFNKFGIM